VEERELVHRRQKKQKKRRRRDTEEQIYAPDSPQEPIIFPKSISVVTEQPRESLNPGQLTSYLDDLMSHHTHTSPTPKQGPTTLSPPPSTSFHTPVVSTPMYRPVAIRHVRSSVAIRPVQNYVVSTPVQSSVLRSLAQTYMADIPRVDVAESLRRRLSGRGEEYRGKEVGSLVGMSSEKRGDHNETAFNL
jgi:hypothetical protein